MAYEQNNELELLEGGESSSSEGEYTQGRPKVTVKRTLAAVLITVATMGSGAAVLAKLRPAAAKASVRNGSFTVLEGKEEAEVTMCTTAEPKVKVENIIRNNLGGQGPDKGPDEGIWLSVKAAEMAGAQIRIHATTPYESNTASSNGLSPSGFMEINVKEDDEVTISADLCQLDDLSDPRGSCTPVILPEFSVSFFDIDGTAEAPECESVTLSRVSQVITEHGGSIITDASEVKSRGVVTWTSDGTSAMKPTSPDSLNQNQKDHAGQATFVGQSGFQMRLKTHGCGARKFIFIAGPVLGCDANVDIVGSLGAASSFAHTWQLATLLVVAGIALTHA